MARAWRRAAALATAGLLLAAVGPAPASGAKPAGDVVRGLAVEWRRDVWLPPEVRTTTLAGTSKLTVATDLRRGGGVRWSPDGSRIGGYHKPTGSGQWDVAIMSVGANGTGELVVLTGAAFDAFNVARGHKPGREHGFGIPFGTAAWAPTGDALVFDGLVRYEGPTTDPIDDRWQSRLFIVAADGSGTLGAVTDGDGEHADFDPHWSAANGRIIFVRSRTQRCSVCEGLPDRVGQQELWTVRPDGTDLRQLTDFATAGLPSGTDTGLGTPTWSPDGHSIAVPGAVGRELYTGDLWQLEVDASSNLVSAAVLRAEAGAAEWHPAWSPDGSRIVFAHLRPANGREERSRIVVRNLATGAETLAVDSTKQVALRPDWNPLVTP